MRYLKALLRPLASSVLIALFVLSNGVGLRPSVVFAEAISFETVKSESITVTGKIIGSYFFAEFSTLHFIDPEAFGYFISAFENQQIPYNGQNTPAASEKVTCNTSNCSHALKAPIAEVAYIVGIGSSNSTGTIAATLNFKPGNTVGVPFSPSIMVAAVGVNSIIASYHMPAGYNPVKSKAWIGLWKGEASSTVQPVGKTNVESLQSQDTQAINGLTVLANTAYTVGFLSGSDIKDIVATATIKTKSYQN